MSLSIRSLMTVSVAGSVLASAFQVAHADLPRRGAPIRGTVHTTPSFHPAPSTHTSPTPSFHPPMSQPEVRRPMTPSRAPVTPTHTEPTHTAPAYTPTHTAPTHTVPAYTPSIPEARRPVVPTQPAYTPSHGPSTPVTPIVTRGRISNGAYGNRGIPTANNPVHYSPMAHEHFEPGTVVNRGSHAEFHYGPNGTATLYRPGSRIPVYTQTHVYGSNQMDMGFRREYHVGNTVVVRSYAPVRWGSSSYTFYRYSPVVHANWGLGVGFHVGYNYYPFHSYSEWCHSPVIWREGFAGWRYNWAYEGWSVSPWYRHYGYYFRPYTEYRSPAFWLTDWYLGNALSRYWAIREEQQNEYEYWNTERYNTFVMDQEIKNELATQMEQTMYEIERRETVPASAYFNDSHAHKFVVSEYTPVYTTYGTTCSLSPLDVIQQYGYIGEGQEIVDMMVMSSKRGSCPRGTVVKLDVSELQEYQNDMYVRVENGMGYMNQRFYH